MTRLSGPPLHHAAFFPQVFRNAGQLTCYDISKNMLKRTRDAVGEDTCAGGGNVRFVFPAFNRVHFFLDVGSAYHPTWWDPQSLAVVLWKKFW